MNPSSPHRPAATADEHILTVQEALEPLYVELEQEVEAALIEAAISAGWSADEALEAIDELKRHDILDDHTS
ncbi:hypothetical protein [Sinorhizobium alkalisoli]|uniref:hypothetical protein n=1 Tax=Sinorhizobium alkalisoli TaxID=1752398 RepID=UPI00124C51AE|nr:hypothetical protein [Sinorhizobium alkalisoli]QFI69034.1 hypothetical protein EKH55_4160 [Sinorhizobium alkalisoli]